MDPIANTITSLINAQRAGKKRTIVPFSKVTRELLTLLVQKGAISHIRVQDGPKATLVVTLAYQDNGSPRLRGVKRISKPGQRIYAGAARMPYSYDRIGFVVVSTSKGLMDEVQARRQHIGGELVCAIW